MEDGYKFYTFYKIIDNQFSFLFIYLGLIDKWVCREKWFFIKYYRDYLFWLHKTLL